MSAPTNYYIYYRAATANGERLQTAVRQMQDAVRAATGVAGRLLRRRDDPQTWMEVYEGVSDTARFESALSEAAATHKLDTLLESPRVIERFVPATDPAA
ncbi:MAG: DUF4936 family protein [Pseudomonadota bacterium]|nr:MAG: DUF4936 domain-containing protein [Pseudomonadota bacterium]